MPASTGLSSISLVLPIRPRPSARSVPRWRSDWPISLRTCVSFSLATRGHLLGVVWLRRPSRLRVLDRLDGPLVGQHFVNLLATRLGDFLGAAQLAERLLRCLQHVDRVRRAERLREHVADAAELEHCAHAAAGDHAGTGRGRAKQAARGVETAERLVRDRLTVLRHREEVLPGVVDRLGDRERHLTCLAVADADAIDLVADDDERREREPATTLDDLRDAVDLDHALLELSAL